jgi:hypothetical protein
MYELVKFISQPLVLSQFLPNIMAAHYSSINIERQHSNISDDMLTSHSKRNREKNHGGN